MDIDGPHARAFVAHLRLKNLSPRTIGEHSAGTRALFGAMAGDSPFVTVQGITRRPSPTNGKAALDEATELPCVEWPSWFYLEKQVLGYYRLVDARQGHGS